MLNIINRFRRNRPSGGVADAELSLVQSHLDFVRSINRFTGIGLAIKLQDETFEIPFDFRHTDAQSKFCSDRRMVFRVSISEEPVAVAIEAGDHSVRLESLKRSAPAKGGPDRSLAVVLTGPDGVPYTFKFTGDSRSVYYRKHDKSEFLNLRLRKGSESVSADGPFWGTYELLCSVGETGVLRLKQRTRDREPSDASQHIQFLSESHPSSVELLDRIREAMDLCSKVLSEWSDENESRIIDFRTPGSRACFSPELRELILGKGKNAPHQI